MITREQVADLQPGDVVELASPTWPEGTTLRGPVMPGTIGHFWLGPIALHGAWNEAVTITVVSRAPRPLYVNHPRTEPVPGDVVRDGRGDLRIVGPADVDEPGLVWWGNGTSHYGVRGRWTHCSTESIREFGPATLLVDGETGQVVP